MFDDLIRVETAVWNRVERRLREEHDLPLQWHEVLDVVVRVPDCRVQDVVRALLITVGGASKLVDKIESAGLVRRVADPRDGRSHRIAPTDEGARTLAALASTVRSEVRSIEQEVPGASLASLAAALAPFRAVLAPAVRPTTTSEEDR